MSAYQKIRRLGREVGLKLSPHVLRHTYAMKLYAQEKDLLLTSQQLGHASPTTTAIYARSYTGDAARQIAALDDDE